MSLPYMNIPQALAEVYRVLLPGGKVSLTIHPISFTLQELQFTRHPKAFLFRLHVLLNGVFLYLFGRTFACLGAPNLSKPSAGCGWRWHAADSQIFVLANSAHDSS